MFISFHIFVGMLMDNDNVNNFVTMLYFEESGFRFIIGTFIYRFLELME